MASNLLKSFKGAIISADFFSAKPSLMHKKSSTFKTLFGGIFSIVILILMGVLTVIYVSKLVNRSIVRTTVSKTFKNIFDGEEPIHFMENGPEFIFKFKGWSLEHDVESLDPKLAVLSIFSSRVGTLRFRISFLVTPLLI